MPKDKLTQVAIVGAGNIGISTAYYLAIKYGITDILLIDAGSPMAFTSAQSGENYRNWWPHPSMVALMDRSIDLMEEIALSSDNRINMTRRGYALATRSNDVDKILSQLRTGPGENTDNLLRFHNKPNAASYLPPCNSDWNTAPAGVDVLQNQQLIRRTFPSYSQDTRTVIHIRRGGDISGQQLGVFMLETLRSMGVKRLTGRVIDIDHTDHFSLNIDLSEGRQTVEAEYIVNAGGPFAGKIAAMLDRELPVYNTFQQKIAFEDKHEAIPRDMPFSIDLDGQLIDWTDDERAMFLEDDEFCWLAEAMPGAIHCRPDGGDNGSWLKMGWAYNDTPAAATWDMPLDEHFPEIVLRAAARLNPALKVYYGRLLRKMHHYGGWYTMTKENWPLIGPMETEGAFMNCAMSGFGTMATCAAGELCAGWVAGAKLPDYARQFSMDRYSDIALIDQLNASSKGIL